MNRRFADMQTNVGNNIQDTSSATQTIIKRFINDAYFDMLRQFNWEFVNYDYSFDTVSGTQDYDLPRDFGKEISVLEDTNNIDLARYDYQKLLRDYPATHDTQGTVERYAIFHRRVAAQPTSSSTIDFVSDNIGDTSQVAFLRGIVDGVEQTDTITLLGTSTATSAKSFTRIISLSFSAERSGKVTVTSNSGAVTVAAVAPEVLDYTAKCIHLHDVPSGTLTIKMPYFIKPLPLKDDNDTPLLPADILEQGATAHAWRYKRQMQKAQEWDRVYKIAITEAIWDKENQMNQVIKFDPLPYSRETV